MKRQITPCKDCELIRNRINGVYCTLLKIYVQHVKEKPCKTKIDCELIRNRINGVYCTLLKIYVQHVKEKPCKTKKK